MGYCWGGRTAWVYARHNSQLNAAVAYYGLLAPKGTPADVIKKLHDAFKQGMDDPVLKKNAADMAVNLDYLGSEAFGKLIAGDHEFYGKLVKDIK